MKPTNNDPASSAFRPRSAATGLMTALALGAMLATVSYADIYRSATNTPGGITSQFSITSVVSGTNTTLSWYGPHAWYTVQVATNSAGPWTDLGTTAATSHNWSVTFYNQGFTNTGLTLYRVKQNNGFVGAGACSGCHGDKYGQYAGTAHSVAYSAASDEPLTSRTVGYGQTNAGGFIDIASTPQLANVGCENCHGPAAWHKYSDHALIRPAVTPDPKVCGGCHTGSDMPQYDEYKTSAHGIGANIVPPNGHATSLGCGFCHSAVYRKTMLNEYYDNLAGQGHPLTLPPSADATAWAITCATCHDPHYYNTNTTAQLRYPTTSTSFFTYPTFIDARSVVTTNLMGVVSTNTVNFNTTCDTFYNTNVQVCAQCHNTRGARWDGRAYGLVTNSVVGGPVTNVVSVNLYTNIITTNVYGSVTVYTTNSYVIGNSNYTVVTPLVTNQVFSVGVITPLVTYSNGLYYATNSDGSFCINSSGYSRVPHYSMQYNELIGIFDFDYFSTNSLGVATNITHNHTTAPKQCATCHVPSYASNGTNVTGHTFTMDTYNCLASCHSYANTNTIALKIEDRQLVTTNAIKRIAGLLNQWAATVAPDVLRTNYGSMAWEYTTPGELGLTNSLAKVGPPSAFAWKTNWTVPSGTNDNLQLQIPLDIRRARFSTYLVLHDGSLGVHNPTFASALLSDAENRVIGQFQASDYPALFSATPTLPGVGTNVVFTNLSSVATGGTWDFGDGVTTTGLNPTHTYATGGVYTVTFTETTSGRALTRTAYIQVNQSPTIRFAADAVIGAAPFTVTFTNYSTGTTNVEWWRWQFNTQTRDGTRLDTLDPTPASYTYTNGGTNNSGVFSVQLRAYLSGTTLTVTSNNYIRVVGADFTALVTNGVAPLTVQFTNTSFGATNYIWDFGDTSSFATPGRTNVVHIYTNAGTYTVTLSASYGSVTSTLARASYIVVGPPPGAVFNADIMSGLAPLTVTFTNLSTNATAYVWSFGDGNASTSTNATVSNTYTNVGTNTVILKAIGSGATNTMTRTNYIIVSSPPTANFSGTSTNGWAPLTVTFTNLSLNASAYAWDFGNGLTSISTNPVVSYSTSGVYNVTLKAINFGGTNTLTRTNFIRAY